ncbi:helix-turn-helix transcriptional regulator [Alcanivorax sp. S6407]|uniref:helix-turn-helix transcriptional regulator n=1 Tax=Alcanivorax sp. S6407 TaxID=2926424 RepID=UPI001FF4F9FB|nr:helix-turn-helix transcriptional regulator [Alcanivorax sp. S6407]MCK0154141.1 helix-turn-helix transcriptional regulator [Alcanivorax sp. S6407]
MTTITATAGGEEATPSTDLQLNEHELHGYNQLISTLYRCLHDSAGFAPFFRAFQAHFKALQGGILGVTSNPQRLCYGWTFGYPEGFEQWYINSDLPERDEAITRFVSQSPRQFDSFLKGQQDGSILDMLSTESRAWAEQSNLIDSAGMLVTQTEQCRVIFMANRHQQHGPYSERELLQMNLLAPHIENAVTLHLKLYQSSNDNENLALALNHVNKALVVCNALGKVAQANQAARDIIDHSSALTLSAEAALTSNNRRLARQLSDAITTSIMHSHQGKLEPVTLFITDQDERLALSLVPLIADNPDNNGVLIEVFSFAASKQPDLEKMQSLFHCTPAEASVAAALMQGLSANEIAEEKGVSVHTARQHIKSLLAKNGFGKQTELIAMLVRALG